MTQVLDTPTASYRAPRSLALEAAGLVTGSSGPFVYPKTTETAADRTIHLDELMRIIFESSKTDTAVDRTIQLDELMRIRKIKSIQEFLIRLKHRANEEGFPSRDVVDRVENVWREADDRYGNLLPLPSMALGEDGGVLFVWKHDPHYLEIEVLPGGSEVFYENTEIGVASHKDVPSVQSEVECAKSWFLSFTDQQAGTYGTAA